jgi:hypothetical protein
MASGEMIMADAPKGTAKVSARPAIAINRNLRMDSPPVGRPQPALLGWQRGFTPPIQWLAGDE